ncbi:unnamed protein product, partial [Rotaria sp. Silwood2]
MSFKTISIKYEHFLYVKYKFHQDVNELMIEKWNLSMMYERYYTKCQPIRCNYSYTTRNNRIYIVSTLCDLADGLVTILKLIVSLLVKLIRRNKRSSMIKS